MSDPTGYKAPRWAWWVATGFGSGYLKPAPGTWGSLAAAMLWFLVMAVSWTRPATDLGMSIHMFMLFLAPLLMTLVAIRASNLVVRENDEEDPSYIVADEWAGQWIALVPLLLNITMFHIPPHWQAARIVAPFLLFRLFDIWKPWPVFQLQRLRSGFGIVLDDVMAGIYAAIPVFFLDRALVEAIYRHLTR